MTHNIIHDEAKIADLVYPIDLSIYAEKEVVMALKEYAEHTLVKFIDSEVERLSKLKHETKVKGVLENFVPFCEAGFMKANTDQITHLQSLKAQLTKSK